MSLAQRQIDTTAAAIVRCITFFASLPVPNALMTQPAPQWSVAIFLARESIDILIRTIQSAMLACGSRVAVIDVLVNGNSELANGAATALTDLVPKNSNCTLRLWFVREGDKGHTWNQFLHVINPGAEVTFFIDGYVEVRPDAFSLIDFGLRAHPLSIAATGLPTSGRSAPALRRDMLRWGGMHGNLFAVRGAVLATLAQRKFRLPLGIYRNDSLLASVFNYNLSPGEFEVDVSRVLIQQDATWDVAEHSQPLWKKVSVQLKRMLRQGQGDLENAALQTHFTTRRLRPETLPETSAELITSWVRANQEQFRKMWMRRPLTWYAYRKIQQPRNWSLSTRTAELILTVEPSQPEHPKPLL